MSYWITDKNFAALLHNRSCEQLLLCTWILNFTAPICCCCLHLRWHRPYPARSFSAKKDVFAVCTPADIDWVRIAVYNQVVSRGNIFQLPFTQRLLITLILHSTRYCRGDSRTFSNVRTYEVLSSYCLEKVKIMRVRNREWGKGRGGGWGRLIPHGSEARVNPEPLKCFTSQWGGPAAKQACGIFCPTVWRMTQCKAVSITPT